MQEIVDTEEDHHPLQVIVNEEEERRKKDIEEEVLQVIPHLNQEVVKERRNQKQENDIPHLVQNLKVLVEPPYI